MRRRANSMEPIDWTTMPLAVPDTIASNITGLSLSFLRKVRSRSSRLKGPKFFRQGKTILYKVTDLKSFISGIEARQ